MRSMFRVLGIYNFANIPKKQQITTILLCTFASYILYAGQAKPGQANRQALVSRPKLERIYKVDAKTFSENWVSKQIFFCFDIDNGLKNIFF